MRNLMSVYKICKSDRNFSSLVFHFTTPFSGCLQKRMSNLCGKNTNSFELLNIFAKKTASQMLDWVENRPLASLQIKSRKCSARKYV